MRKIIAIIGDAATEPNGLKERHAYETGKLLVDNGYRVQSGGMRGVMDAAFRGAKASEKYREGDTVAISPTYGRDKASGNADIIIATGLDIFRNVIVANADAVIAVGGGAGTLSEIANAWALKRLVIAFSDCEGWSSLLADKRVDGRVRYKDIPDDRVYGVTSAEEAIAILNERLDRYDSDFGGIGR